MLEELDRLKCHFPTDAVDAAAEFISTMCTPVTSAGGIISAPFNLHQRNITLDGIVVMILILFTSSPRESYYRPVSTMLSLLDFERVAAVDMDTLEAAKRFLDKTGERNKRIAASIERLLSSAQDPDPADLFDGLCRFVITGLDAATTTVPSLLRDTSSRRLMWSRIHAAGRSTFGVAGVKEGVMMAVVVTVFTTLGVEKAKIARVLRSKPVSLNLEMKKLIAAVPVASAIRAPTVEIED